MNNDSGSGERDKPGNFLHFSPPLSPDLFSEFDDKRDTKSSPPSNLAPSTRGQKISVSSTKPPQISWDNNTSDCEFNTDTSVTSSQLRTFVLNGPQTPLPIISNLSQELAEITSLRSALPKGNSSASSSASTTTVGVPASTESAPSGEHNQMPTSFPAADSSNRSGTNSLDTIPFAVLNQQMYHQMSQMNDAAMWAGMVNAIPSHDQLSSAMSNGDTELPPPTYQELVPVKKDANDSSVDIKEETPGPFSVFVASQRKNSKNLDYVAVEPSDGAGYTSTVYCKADAVVPFQFRFPASVRNAACLRLKVEHIDQRYQKEAVERCANHRCKDESVRRNHFIRSSEPHSVADYRPFEEGYSVVLPIMAQTGLSFTCYNSCMGEQEKKSLRIVFSIESADKSLIDSCSVVLKVCANPLRDLLKETNKGDEIRRSTLDGRKRLSGLLTNTMPYTLTSPKEEAGMKRARMSDSDRVGDGSSGMGQSVLDERVFTISFGGGVESYRNMVSVAADKERSIRYEARRMEERGLGINLFRGLSQMHRGTDVRSWLALPTINLADYATVFNQHGIYYMGDLADMYTSDVMVFHHLGLPADIFTRLRRIFVNWYTVYIADAAGQGPF